MAQRCAATVIAAAAMTWLVTGGSGLALAGRTSSGYCRDRNTSFHGNRFVGINDVELVVSSSAYQSCSAGRMAATGVGYFRYPLSWASVEPQPGKFDFRVYDVLIALLARHRIASLPVLIGAPSWAAAGGVGSGTARPAHDGGFARFAAAVVRRYGPRGDFWKFYPSVPRMPVRDWQVWNEPNLSSFWAPHPDPRGYAALLAATHGAIKRVDPRADVVTAGMPYFGPRLSAVAFYREMFRDRGVRDFDTLAFNDYAPTVSAAVRRLFSVRLLMNRHRARRRALWITEFGWASGGPPSPYTARNDRDQRAKIAGLMSAIRRYRVGLGLKGAMLWSWADQPLAPGRNDYWGLHAGLYRLNLGAKPAASAFGRVARQLSR
jgi:hypothetical protein